MKIKNLFVVSDEFEAKQAIKYYNKDSVILSLGLEAELFVREHLDNYLNPLYKFLDLEHTSYQAFYHNFKLAYDWAGKDEYLLHIRDRLGYYLTEFERSVAFADKLLKFYQPKTIWFGEIKSYSGSSVINGSLKVNALYLVAKEKNIKRSVLRSYKPSAHIQKNIGSFLKYLDNLKKRTISNAYPIIILAPARHMIQLLPTIAALRDQGVEPLNITYGATYTQRRLLKKAGLNFVEKEYFLNSRVKNFANDAHRRYVKRKVWNTFFAHPYKNRQILHLHLRNKIASMVQGEFLEIIVDKYLATEILSRVKTGLLLTTTDPDSKAISFILAAKDISIATIALQHGAMWSPAPLSVVPVSDTFIAWSNFSKTWVGKIKGFKNINVVIGRSPFHHLGKRVRSRTISKSSQKIRLLYLVTIVILDLDVIAYYLNKLFRSLETTNVELEVKIRMHPFQNRQNIAALIKHSRLDVSFDENISLEQTVAWSDVVIAEETTACFDVMLAKKPLIFFNPYTGEDYFEAKKRDYAMTILSEHDLEVNLPMYLSRRALWSKYTNKGLIFAKKYLGVDKDISVLAKVLTRPIGVRNV